MNEIVEYPQKITVNLLGFLIQCIAGTPKAYKYIDKTYYENQELYFEMIEQNKEKWIEEYEIYKYSIEAKNYFLKLLAISDDILKDSKEHGMCSIHNEHAINLILEYVYSDAFNYAVSSPHIKLSAYIKKLNKKHKPGSLNDDEYFGKITTVILTGGIERVDTKDEFYINFINMIHNLNSFKRKNGFKTQFLYKNADKERQKLINKIELVLRGRFYEHGYSVQSIIEKAFEGNSYVGDGRYSIEGVERSQVVKHLLGLESCIDMNRKLPTGIFQESSYKASINDIKDYINVYLTIGKYTELNSVDYDDLHSFVNLIIINMCYLHAYKDADNFFFNNYNEKMNVELSRVNSELREAKKSILKLQDKNISMKNENEALKKELELLRKELREESYNKKELVELRNNIFNQNVEDFERDSNECNIEEINNISALCVGGNKAWIDRMKEILPNWNFISEDIINFDTSIISSYDYIFVKAIHMSHAQYFRVVSAMNDNQELRYINHNNIEKVLKNIEMAIK